MKKPAKIVLIVLPCLALAGLLVAYFSLNAMVKAAVVRVLPGITGTSVRLDEIDIKPFAGRVTIVGLAIGNPEGFRTDSAFQFSRVRVHFDFWSLLSDTVHIRQIYVEKPRITYEAGLEGSNLGKIREHMKGRRGGGDEALSGSDTRADGAKRVIIDDFIMKDAQVRVAGRELNRSTTVDLGTVRIRDIGRQKGGVAVAQAALQIFQPVAAAVEGLARSAKRVVREGTEATGKAAREAREKVKEARKRLKQKTTGLVRDIKDILGKE